MSRFVNLAKREVEQIDLSGGDWIIVKKVLTNGERKRMDTGAMRFTARPGDDTSANIEVDIEKFDKLRALTYLADWSFTDGDGKKVQLNEENYDLLDESTAKEINEALNKFVSEREKEKNSSSPPGRPLKRVGSGSTSQS